MNRHNIALIRSLQHIWSHPDPDAFAALFTPDGLYEDKVYKIILTDHEAMRAHIRRVAKHSLGLKVEISHCDATDSTGAAEWCLTHDYVGNFEGVDCSGIPIVIHGLSLYQFRDGLISRASDYWDYMEIIRTLGVIPRELRGLRTA